MVRAQCALAALLIASVAVPAISLAQTKSWSNRPPETAAQAHRAAACKAQATAQNVHGGARVDFITDCMAKK